MATLVYVSLFVPFAGTVPVSVREKELLKTAINKVLSHFQSLWHTHRRTHVSPKHSYAPLEPQSSGPSDVVCVVGDQQLRRPWAADSPSRVGSIRFRPVSVC